MANFSAVPLLGSNAFEPSTTQSHALGTRRTFEIRSASGNPASCTALYVKAEATLAVGQLCELPLIRGTDYCEIDTPITTTNAATFAGAITRRFAVGVPLIGMVNGEYGWLAVSGTIPVLLAANCVGQALLFTTATAGVVDDADTDYEVVGLFAVSTITTATIADCIAYNDLHIRRDV